MAVSCNIVKPVQNNDQPLRLASNDSALYLAPNRRLALRTSISAGPPDHVVYFSYIQICISHMRIYIYVILYMIYTHAHTCLHSHICTCMHEYAHTSIHSPSSSGDICSHSGTLSEEHWHRVIDTHTQTPDAEAPSHVVKKERGEKNDNMVPEKQQQ